LHLRPARVGVRFSAAVASLPEPKTKLKQLEQQQSTQ